MHEPLLADLSFEIPWVGGGRRGKPAKTDEDGTFLQIND